MRTAVRARLGAGLPPADPTGHARTLATARAALGDVAFAAAYERGQALPPEEAIAGAIGDGA